MREQLNKIIESDFDTIQKDGELSLLLLKLYSQLFLGGSQPSTCGKCMRDYYSKLINQGSKILERMENKTCQLKDGLIYIRQECKHFSNNNITDEKAIELLEKGLLKESHFDILPKSFAKPVEQLELIKENLGKFTEENLKIHKGHPLMTFAKEITNESVGSKAGAIEAILNKQ